MENKKYLDHDPDKMWEEIKKEFPSAKMVNKNKSLFMKIIFTPLSWITKKDYINDYVTTIFFKVYVPDHWFSEKRNYYSRFNVLRHEREHMRQFKCFPFGKYFKYLNMLIVSLLYVLALPCFFTFRSYFEKQGYKQNLLTHYEKYGDLDYNKQEKALLDIFCGPKYFWMSTKYFFKKWLKKTIKSINSNKK